MAADLVSLEVWRETAEDLARRALEAEMGSDEQNNLAFVALLFCVGQVTVDEVDRLLNGE